MPLQIKRILLVFVVLVIGMLILKFLLTPDSWREHGPYRGAALGEIANQQMKYFGDNDCLMCHDSIAEMYIKGPHSTVQCEVCHGPGYLHIDDQDEYHMEIPSDNNLCLKCHRYNSAKPKNIIKQIDPVEHAEEEDCINCHNPHLPWE